MEKRLRKCLLYRDTICLQFMLKRPSHRLYAISLVDYFLKAISRTVTIDKNIFILGITRTKKTQKKTDR